MQYSSNRELKKLNLELTELLEKLIKEVKNTNLELKEIKSNTTPAITPEL